MIWALQLVAYTALPRFLNPDGSVALGNVKFAISSRVSLNGNDRSSPSLLDCVAGRSTPDLDLSSRPRRYGRGSKLTSFPGVRGKESRLRDEVIASPAVCICVDPRERAPWPAMHTQAPGIG